MAQDTATTAVLTHSGLATARIFVVLLAGFLASKWPRHDPLLTREACRCVSRVCALLFQPALVISSTGGTLNFADLQNSWQLVVAGGLTIGLSVAVAWVSARLLLGPESRRAIRPVELAVAFQNCAFIPLLLMESLCEQDAIKSDFGDDADECFNQATSMIFLYYASWQVCFYAWGFYALGQDDTLELKLTAQLVRAPLAAVEDAPPATLSPCQYSQAVSEGGGTLSNGSSSSSSGIAVGERDTPSNGSSSSSSIASRPRDTPNNDSSSTAKAGVLENGTVAVDVRQLDQALVASPLPGLRADGMVAADVQIDSAFGTPPSRPRANSIVPVDVQLGIPLMAVPAGLRARGRSLGNGSIVSPDVNLDAVALATPLGFRANGVDTGNVLVGPPSPPPPPRGGRRPCDRNAAKKSAHAPRGGGSGGDGGCDEYVTGVQQQHALAVDYVNGESSRLQTSPPLGGLRACGCELTNGGNHPPRGGGDGRYNNDTGMQQQVVAVDDANRESSRFQGYTGVLPSAEEAVPQGCRSHDSESLTTTSPYRRNSREQRTVSAEETKDGAVSPAEHQRTKPREAINTALGTAKAGLGRRGRSRAVGPLAAASCRGNSIQGRTTPSEEHNVPLDGETKQQTTTGGAKKNVVLGSTTPTQRQRTTASEENVTLDGVTGGLGGGGRDGSWARVWWQRVSVVLLSPNIVAVAVGIVIAMISPLQDVLFSDPQAVLRPLGAALETLGSPTVATSLLVMAGSLSQVRATGAVGAGGEQPGGKSWRRWHFIAGVFLVACRLVMVPAIGFGIFWVATKHVTVLGENRLMRMIMLIELAMPSGAFIIVSLTQLKMPATAGFMARLYLWQHGASVLTISLWTALAVHMLY